jgi:hypothetical protein
VAGAPPGLRKTDWRVGVLMDLVAGDPRDILLALGVDEWAGLRDPRRFVAYISLGGGMDPAWLDLFARAARETTGGNAPGLFSEATRALQSRLTAMSDRMVERVDPHLIDDVARLPEGQLDRIAFRWIDLIDCEECEVDPDEKPMLRELAGDLLAFCRRARDAEDVLLAWTI